MRFHYLAYAHSQGLTKGDINALDESEARERVIQLGYRPLRVSPAKQLPALESVFPFLFSVSKGELIRFFRQLSVMLGSGDNLLSTLDILYLETRNKPMRRIIDAVRKTLVTGGSFSSALAQFPTVFDSVLVAMVGAGEHTGRLGPALDQLAEIIEKEEEAKKKAIKTLMYPMAIIGLSLVTLAVLITVALPPLLASFEQLGTEVPRMTRIALGIVSVVKNNLLNVIIGFLSVVISIRLARRMPRARYLMEKGQLRLPLLGTLSIAKELARFSRTITLLLEAGVSPSEAFQLAAKGCKNTVIQMAYVDAIDSLMNGHGIAEGLKQHSLFPMVFVRLVRIGEESNSLPRTMKEATEAYQKEFEHRISSLVGVLEPASTVIVGAIVGFIAFSMFLPIYTGLDAIR